MGDGCHMPCSHRPSYEGKRTPYDPTGPGPRGGGSKGGCSGDMVMCRAAEAVRRQRALCFDHCWQGCVCRRGRCRGAGWRRSRLAWRLGGQGKACVACMARGSHGCLRDAHTLLHVASGPCQFGPRTARRSVPCPRCPVAPSALASPRTTSSSSTPSALKALTTRPFPVAAAAAAAGDASIAAAGSSSLVTVSGPTAAAAGMEVSNRKLCWRCSAKRAGAKPEIASC